MEGKFHFKESLFKKNENNFENSKKNSLRDILEFISKIEVIKKYY